MTWAPPDSPSDFILRQVITRAREEAINGFAAERKRIEREQAAKGVLGGPVLSSCGAAAEASIKSFGAPCLAIGGAHRVERSWPARARRRA